MLTSHRTSSLLAAAEPFLRQQAKLGEVLVVAPSREAADDFVRRACGQAMVGVHRIALDQLAARMAEHRSAELGVAPMNSVVQEAVAARVVHLAKLTYFEPVAGMPGFARGLGRTLRDLRLEQMEPAALHAAGPAGDDLAVLMELYAEEMDKHGYADLAARYALATEAARSGRHALCGLPILLLDVTPENSSERGFLDALLSSASEVLAVASETRRLQAEDLLGVNADSIAGNVSDCLQSVQENLFSVRAIQGRDSDASFELFSASGEALECVEIARRIQRLCAAGVRFDEVAVLLRGPDRYQPMVEEAFRRGGIPAWYSTGSRRPNPNGRAFLALLHCAQEGLSASRFAEYLSLGAVQGIAGWERLIVDASVVGGSDRWERRLQGLERTFEDALQAAEDEPAREYYHRNLTRLQALGAFALPLIRKLEALPALALWGEWLDALAELAPMALQDPQSVEDLLDELRLLADLGPVEMFDVLLVLEERLRFLRSPVPEARYGKVFVGGIEEAQAMSFRVVFVPGLSEGGFPRPIFDDPLLLNDHKQKISSSLRLAGEEDEQRLLHTAVGCAAERLVASYPRIDLLTGRARVLSLYAYELVKAARGAAVDVRDVEAQARQATSTRVGWPAPGDPAEAIDNAEFDLAVLEPAFHGKEGKGSAGYLTKVNAHLVRSLRARGRRWRNKWFEEDGLVQLDIHALQILEEHRLSRHAYSPSALQQYAVCPYRFALRAIHKLHPAVETEPLQRMDPVTRGNLFHRVQFEVLRELRGDEEFPAARKKLDAALDRVAAEFAERLAPAIPHIWNSEVERIRTDLTGWLAASDHGWSPVASELSFGLAADDQHDPKSSAEPVAVLDGMLLRGSIDLVERHSSGMLRVVDHKTGKPPSPLPQLVGKGEVLQPILYALAAEQLLNDKVATGRLYYATLRGNFRTLDVPIQDFARQRMRQVLHTIDQAIYEGFLPPAPRKDACERCDYLPVCGPYEPERIERKPKPERKPLEDLRKLP